VLKECISGNLEILVFLGTWCGDSRREVPIFLKTAKAAGLKATSWKLYGVDVAKKMEGGLIEQYQIKRVPTFIVLRDGKEIGRIVEYTKVSMEADLIEVLKAK
jgi:thiol-disulfide isomerase/thioredoxin